MTDTKLVTRQCGQKCGPIQAAADAKLCPQCGNPFTDKPAAAPQPSTAANPPAAQAPAPSAAPAPPQPATAPEPAPASAPASDSAAK